MASGAAVCANRRTHEEAFPPLSSLERTRTSETRKHASALALKANLFVSTSGFYLPPAAEGRWGAEKQISLTPTETRGLITAREWQRTAESFVSMEMR